MAESGIKDKGQHLRLTFTAMGGHSLPAGSFVTLCKTMSFHLSKQLENSTTKDTTDTTGNWANFDPVENSGDIQFSGLLATSRDGEAHDSLLFEDFINMVLDEPIDWKLVTVTGSKNRTIVKTLCSGQGKLTNVKADGQLKQDATYSGTINIVGPVTVGSD